MANKPVQTSSNQFSKADNRRLEVTLLIYILCILPPPSLHRVGPIKNLTNLITPSGRILSNCNLKAHLMNFLGHTGWPHNSLFTTFAVWAVCLGKIVEFPALKEKVSSVPPFYIHPKIKRLLIVFSFHSGRWKVRYLLFKACYRTFEKMLDLVVQKSLKNIEKCFLEDRIQLHCTFKRLKYSNSSGFFFLLIYSSKTYRLILTLY